MCVLFYCSHAYVGAGDEFLRWSFQQSDKRTFSRSSRTKGDAPELLRNIEESHSRLNAVAMFFLKRSFKHIRWATFFVSACDSVAVLIWCTSDGRLIPKGSETGAETLRFDLLANNAKRFVMLF